MKTMYKLPSEQDEVITLNLFIYTLLRFPLKIYHSDLLSAEIGLSSGVLFTKEQNLYENPKIHNFFFLICIEINEKYVKTVFQINFGNVKIHELPVKKFQLID